MKQGVSLANTLAVRVKLRLAQSPLRLHGL